MYKQSVTALPSARTVNTQEEDYQEYSQIQKKLQSYKDNLKIIQKNNEDDRRYLTSCSDVLQLTESQEDENEQLKQKIMHLQDELVKTKQGMMSVVDELSQQRDLLYFKVQELEKTVEIFQQQQQSQLVRNKSGHSTLLDITYEQDITQDYGRRRTKSKYEDQYKRIVEELSDILKTENIVQEVYRLQQKCTKQDKFIGCIQDLVTKLTPKEIFQNSKPQLRDCWHWIKGICNEYMILKRSQSNLIIDSCCKILRVAPHELIDEIELLISMLKKKQS